MVNEELKNYISECLKLGQAKEEIARSLIAAGWSISDIEETIRILMEDSRASSNIEVNKNKIDVATQAKTFKNSWLG